MAERVLRDQCKHGRYDEHRVNNSAKWEWCDGGREVTIDYEAAYQWASENFVPQKFIDQCLDAALGEGGG